VRVKPAHRGTPVGAGFLPALTLRVENQEAYASKAQVGNLRLRGRRVKPAHRGTPVGAGFLPASLLRVENQEVCASRTQVGKPAATGGPQKQSAGRKTCGYGGGRAGCDASAPRDTRRCRFFTCTNATGGKPRRVCEQSAGRKTCGYGARSKSTRAPVSRPPKQQLPERLASPP